MPTKKETKASTPKKTTEKKGRPKGLPKTGGRTKGTPNKVTQSIRSQLEKQLEPFIGNIGTMLMKIADPADRMHALVSLLPYIAPKLQNIDVTSENKHDVSIEQYLISLDSKFKDKEKELAAKKIKMVSFD